MTTLLTSIKSRLAELERTIIGVKRAYTEAPAILPHADLPIFCNFVGPATYTPLGETLAEETRTFVMKLYVKPIQQGVDGEAESSCVEMLIPARDVFIAHPHLGNGAVGKTLNFVERAEYQGDSGILVLPYANETFIGAEFRMNITTVVLRQIAKYE